ncbi:transcriptional regulator [Gallibacterium salpingitidis]|uniref:Transcriptional regulator n=1 Tax=Gallibacterium salpingitidis TaxID=505341 RepID=A0A1A7PZ40_9PAST|nr:Mor transcription activator family protein [Gallibacterium salpingitidis]OBX07046.1 transcriptional regulator [Gallibacterium salpingitidis]OBX07062.1 transcriptional regulator [Gallibacterium salpingitidis]OBX09731.1 transcriptional regulator [Gallibacterium salpingitidis]
MENKTTFEDKAPEILLDLAEHTREMLVKKHQFDNDKAKQIGIELAQCIAESWGGEIIYIPKALLIALSERDLAIWREFNGSNHRELSRKYGVSMQWVYQIVKRVQKEEVAKRQYDMFNEKNV